MTIQRRYILPNCSLVLEGLGDAVGSSQSFRPQMSTLFNVECSLPRLSEPISGGRQFLESLITAVSGYTQELLSGISRPVSKEGESGIVRLQKGKSADYHILSVYPEPEEGNSAVDSTPTKQVELTTVELFDVLEAIDQLLADSSTLPDLSLNLKPVSRRYAATHNSVNKRLKPLALGLTGLTVAGITSYLIPVPKVEKPKSTPVATSTASPVASPTPAVNTTPSNAEITDAKLVDTLTKQTNSKLGATWNNKSKIKEDLVYQVNVDSQGQILSYSGANKTATDSIKLTPLPNLAVKAQPTPGVAVAKLKAVFQPDGKVAVSRWNP